MGELERDRSDLKLKFVQLGARHESAVVTVATRMVLPMTLEGRVLTVAVADVYEAYVFGLGVSEALSRG